MQLEVPVCSSLLLEGPAGHWLATASVFTGDGLERRALWHGALTVQCRSLSLLSAPEPGLAAVHPRPGLEQLSYLQLPLFLSIATTPLVSII